MLTAQSQLGRVGNLLLGISCELLIFLSKRANEQFALLKERIPLFALLVKSGESDSFFYKEQEEQCRLICYFVLGIKGEKHGEKTKFDANHYSKERIVPVVL